MSHIPYTICRSGTYYDNRHVPKHEAKAYGSFIRQAMSRCPEEAEAYSKRLGNILCGSWSRSIEIIQPVDISALLISFKSRSFVLSEIAEEYIALRDIDERPPRIAMLGFTALAGHGDVSEYTIEDAKLYVCHLEMKGNKTATIRRRINSLSAILSYAYTELELDNKTPSQD